MLGNLFFVQQICFSFLKRSSSILKYQIDVHHIAWQLLKMSHVNVSPLASSIIYVVRLLGLGTLDKAKHLQAV